MGKKILQKPRLSGRWMEGAKGGKTLRISGQYLWRYGTVPVPAGYVMVYVLLRPVFNRRDSFHKFDIHMYHVQFVDIKNVV
jgi:hypothetical protein